MTIPAPDTRTDKNLEAACTTLAGEIARTDGKASLLLAFNGAVLAGLAAAAGHPLPTVAKVFAVAAVLALATAAVLLLLVVRPRLGGSDRASFPYWARLDDDAIQASMGGDSRPARIRVLSTIAVRKFTQLRSAVDTTLAALALLLLAALAALV
ncbi:Pycsar system effector family protein [Streptomyces sp. NPDC020489]|uniref:Pycsar system effector family protein n=1 Tax=Streptomyces sp. NPDC020489 TaxID=3365077 RepID=UPI0037A93E70